jgi:hypothetical protein
MVVIIKIELCGSPKRVDAVKFNSVFVDDSSVEAENQFLCLLAFRFFFIFRFAFFSYVWVAFKTSIGAMHIFFFSCVVSLASSCSHSQPF